jgi:Predicted extracellular endo alpha-1,4 polygalactosaminidase or related polysaccharide hydrolase
MGIFWKAFPLILVVLILLSSGCTDSSYDTWKPDTPLPTGAGSYETTVPSAGHGTLSKGKLSSIQTYANSYTSYTEEDLATLKRFDAVMVEPYEMPASYVAELKGAGTAVIAYISIGEADEGRRYWNTWEPTERAPDLPTIPRTLLDARNPLFLGPDPEWPGSYFVDASDETWQTILVEEEIPYVLALGGDRYDGLVMDVIDVVDEYDGWPREEEMREGMIALIRKIRQKYPHLLLIPNRGFGIAEAMGPYVDGIKFEELTFRFDEDGNGRYIAQVNVAGIHDNQEEIDAAVSMARRYNLPIFVLDHVETRPPDRTSALRGYEEARRLSERYGVPFLWYANSIDQDLPLWDFLPYSR